MRLRSGRDVQADSEQGSIRTNPILGSEYEAPCSDTPRSDLGDDPPDWRMVKTRFAEPVQDSPSHWFAERLGKELPTMVSRVGDYPYAD
jgi:hypothetical protein